MTQLAQCLGLDLPDALARDRERLPHFLERMLTAIFQPEAHLDYFLFARRQRAQHLRGLVFQVDIDTASGGRDKPRILMEVTRWGSSSLPNGGSREVGFCAILSPFATFGNGIIIRLAIF